MDRRVEVLKALSDKNRLLILDMLSCGELCGCEILDGLDLTQPTISHHMKILVRSGVVIGRKSGKWMHYSIDRTIIEDLKDYLDHLTMDKEDCICHNTTIVCEHPS